MNAFINAVIFWQLKTGKPFLSVQLYFIYFTKQSNLFVPKNWLEICIYSFTQSNLCVEMCKRFNYTTVRRVYCILYRLTVVLILSLIVTENKILDFLTVILKEHWLRSRQCWLTLLVEPHLSGPNMMVYGVLSWNDRYNEIRNSFLHFVATHIKFVSTFMLSV